MKKDLDHLSARKQAVLRRVVEVIQESVRLSWPSTRSNSEKRHWRSSGGGR